MVRTARVVLHCLQFSPTYFALVNESQRSWSHVLLDLVSWTGTNCWYSDPAGNESEPLFRSVKSADQASQRFTKFLWYSRSDSRTVTLPNPVVNFIY